MRVTVCVNSRCPLKHKCGKVFQPEELRGTIQYKHFHFIRDHSGFVSCPDYSRSLTHGR